MVKSNSTATRKATKQRQPTFPSSMDAFFTDLVEKIDNPVTAAEKAASSFFANEKAQGNARNKVLRQKQIDTVLRMHPVWGDLIGGPLAVLPRQANVVVPIREYHRSHMNLLVKLAKESIAYTDKRKKTPTIRNLVQPPSRSRLKTALDNAIKKLRPICRNHHLPEDTEKALLVYNLLCIFGGYRQTSFYTALYDDKSMGWKTALNQPLTTREKDAFKSAIGKIKWRLNPSRSKKHGQIAKWNDEDNIKSLLNGAGLARTTEFEVWPLPAGQAVRAIAWRNRLCVDVCSVLIASQSATVVAMHLPSTIAKSTPYQYPPLACPLSTQHTCGPIKQNTALMAQLIVDQWFQSVLNHKLVASAEDRFWRHFQEK